MANEHSGLHIILVNLIYKLFIILLKLFISSERTLYACPRRLIMQFESCQFVEVPNNTWKMADGTVAGLAILFPFCERITLTG